MIRSLTIDNFRGFDHFELHDLGRVNLIVGTNNSGKTSVLEAVDLASANGEVSVLSRIHLRRSEDLEEERDPRMSRRRFIDVRRLFRGHSLDVGNSFQLVAKSDDTIHTMSAEVRHISIRDVPSNVIPATSDGEFEGVVSRILELNWMPSPGKVLAELAPNGAVPLESIRYNRTAKETPGAESNIRFVSANSLTPDEAIELFARVQLRPQEQFVYESLRIIEPGIQRLGIQIERLKGRGLSGLRGGFSVLLSDFPEPIPIGSMGEGIWRLLALALCLARAENGILLIDEIDTGLHYSVMEKMWRLVTETAKRLNVQVFATSHSRDCYESLAAVCRESVTDNSEVTIQRIERGKKRSVAFSEREIVIAAERGIEVR